MTCLRHTASLRDPAGRLMETEDRLVRLIHPQYADKYRNLFGTAWFQELVASGEIVKSFVVTGDELHNSEFCLEQGSLVVEHERVAFPSYPCEWPLEMLCAAAELTISLSVKILPYCYGLKDATPWNVLFKGPQPVFVDVLSFETRSPHDPTWLAYGQYVRTFLLPALMDAYYGMACHHLFLSRRDGIEPEEVYPLLGPWARITPPFLGTVTMPVLLASSARANSSILYTTRIISNIDQAKYTLTTRYNRLRRTTKSTARRRSSLQKWTNYTQTCTYSEADTACKTTFVEKFLHHERPVRVLDVGCNTGHFSFLASRHGADVVAIDLDPEAVGNLWQRARIENASILPLVVNIARPTPALGWRNGESLSFLERAEGHFDAIMMLAVVHHLLVTEQIPLDEIVLQAARLTTEWIVIEYVGPDDPQFKRLLKGRGELYNWYDRETFEYTLETRFDIVRSEQILGNMRWLYLAKRRNCD